MSAAVTVAAVTVPPATAHAQTLVACNEVALKQAISNANASGGGALVLTPGCTYTITQDEDNDGNGLPVIASPIVITGTGNVIQRSSTASEFRIFQIDGSGGARGNLSLNVLTVRGGRSTGVGGGIWVRSGGRLAVTAGNVTGNSAAQAGGGIENDGGTVVFGSSRLDGNTAPQGAGMNMQGAGVDTVGGTAVFGGLSRIASNTATGDGGGIRSKGALTLTDSVVELNQAAHGGGIDVRAGLGVTATLRSTTVRENTVGTAVSDGARGGGIRNAARLVLDESYVHHNDAIGTNAKGAGLANLPLTAVASLSRSEVTENTATTAPGGIYNAGVVALAGSLVLFNSPTNCSGSPVLVPGCVG
ncbi:hypothetical protein ACWDYJ_23745 [Streptomyces sp. NPDC003042]